MRVALFVAGLVAMAWGSPMALVAQDSKPSDVRSKDKASSAKTVPAAKSPVRTVPATKVVPAARVAPARAATEAVAVTPEVKEIDEKATHRQTRIIEVAHGSNDAMKVNAFCLDAQGRILAACGEGPGEVRLLDADGKSLSSWAVPVKPESINTAVDGTVLIAGEGKLFRYSAAGKLLKESESPHSAALRDNKEKLREQAVQNLSRAANSISSRIATYQQIIDSINKKKEAKEEVNAQEEQILKFLPQQLEALKKQQAEQGEKAPKISEEAIEQQVASLSKYKKRMCSISADKDYVYVATPALVGYGYEVWRMNHEFQSGEVIVSGLSGCCGQMDVQASAAGLYVAENSRHRVVRYQTDGKLVSTWGKGDRSGLEGFSSCCNPMNVCFSKNGDVFTAESTTGRIKRFTADGKFVDYVGDIKLVPGCKNVSIAVSPSGDRVYMLDITRNHIVLMERKAAEAAAAATTSAAK